MQRRLLKSRGYRVRGDLNGGTVPLEHGQGCVHVDCGAPITASPLDNSASRGMYMYEIATIGSAAGRPYDHANDLEAAAYCLGAGAVGARVSMTLA